MSYFLSICIPTYNGGENLKYNVNKLIKMQPEFGFEVCVSDNASYDGTQEFMKDIIDKYDFVKYHRNEENLGFAYNFDYVLNMANGEYRWLLGDDDEVIEENLEKVISSLKEYQPDICVVNGYDHKVCIKNFKSQTLFDKNIILKEFASHMSWISTLIFSKHSLKNINIKIFDNNAFPHLISIFKYFNVNCSFCWIENICVKPQENVQHRYTKKILIYFLRDWYYVSEAIGNYSCDSKKSFLLKSPLIKITIVGALLFRKNGILSDEVYQEIKSVLKFYPVDIKYKLYLSKNVSIKFLKIISKIKRVLL